MSIFHGGFVEGRQRWLGVGLVSCFLVSLVWLEVSGESYRYDASGRLVGVTYEDGLEISYSYDSRGNLTDRTVASPGDADRDRMDDQWELRFFGGSERDGSGDFDRDGQNDFHEFVAQTDPTDPESVLRFNAVQRLPEGGVSVSWASVDNVRYQLQAKDDLVSDEWLDVGVVVEGNGGLLSIGDVRAAEDEGARFYRVLVLP